MITLAYAVTAVAFLILVLGLARRNQSREPDECNSDTRPTPNVENARWLRLSERIFDPSDIRWLEDELAFPKLAACLRLGRKHLAISWLEALQASFDELVRTPAASSSEAAEGRPLDGWRMLWLTLRFKFLVWYALVAVRVFGPYHRLIPSFAWAPGLQGRGQSFRQPALANTRVSD